jgi:hypothetical protein
MTTPTHLENRIAELEQQNSLLKLAYKNLIIQQAVLKFKLADREEQAPPPAPEPTPDLAQQPPCSGSTVYVLFYDTDFGSREEWNTFYTPCEVFLSPEGRQARIDKLKHAVDSDGDPIRYEFHELDVPAFA